MKQSSKRVTSMLVALLFMVGAFIIFFDLIQPTYADVQTLRGEVASAQATLDQEKQSVQQFQSLLAKYHSETNVQQSLALALPSGPDVSGALAQLYGIAANDGLAVQSVSISAPTAEVSGAADQGLNPPGIFTMQISTTGSYENLKQFIADLETNIRIFDLTTFGLQSAATASPGSKASSVDSFSASFSVVTYYNAQ